MRKLFLCLLIGMIYFNGSAQTLKAYEKAAEEALARKDYYSAIYYYNTVLEVKPDKAKVWYALGEAAQAYQSYTLAEKAFTKVNESDDRINFPLTDLMLGKVKRHLGAYEDAKIILNRFISEYATSNEDWYHLAYKEINACTKALEILDYPVGTVTVTQLNDEVNTPFSEFSPQYIDGKLYFSSLRTSVNLDQAEDYKLNSTVLETDLNGASGVFELFEGDSSNVAHMVFDKEAARIYFTRCKYINSSDLQCELFYQEQFDEEIWGPPVKLPKYINYPEATTTQPSIAFDARLGKKVLYFTSDRPGGSGKLDIWRSVITRDGKVLEPENLSALNTAEDEVSPFFHTPSQVLYFSSNGMDGLGGFDVFRSSNFSDPDWLESQNLGYPLNSSFNDVDFFLTENGLEGFLSSNRKGAKYIDEVMETCCNDLYALKFDPVDLNLNLTAYDESTGDEVNQFELKVVDLGNNILQTLESGSSNKVTTPLEPASSFVLYINRPGYYPDSLRVSTMGILDNESINREVFLKPLKVDLLALTFDANGNEPLEGARVDLIEADLSEAVWKRNYQGNDFFFPLEEERSYYVSAFKEGYFPDTIQIGPEEYAKVENGLLSLKFYLEPKPSTIATMSEYLPLPVFFNNDQPDASFAKIDGERLYDTLFYEYYRQKPTFIKEFTKGLMREDLILAQEAMEHFFEEEVRLGHESLHGFLSHLDKYLAEGNQAELMIKGYASPLADKEYNKELTARRTKVLINEILNYRNGHLESFIENGKLIITEVPYGESRAPDYVSDDRKDARNSIYSVVASRERRVEIIEIINPNMGSSVDLKEITQGTFTTKADEAQK